MAKKKKNNLKQGKKVGKNRTELSKKKRKPFENKLDKLNKPFSEDSSSQELSLHKDYSKLDWFSLNEKFEYELNKLDINPINMELFNYVRSDLYCVKSELINRNLSSRVILDRNYDLELLIKKEIKPKVTIDITDDSIEKSKLIAKKLVDLGKAAGLGKNEIYLAGVCDKSNYDKDDFIVEDIYIVPDQVCSNERCEFPSTGKFKMLDELDKLKKVPIMWIHSHCDDTYFSPDDKDNLFNLVRFDGFLKELSYELLDEKSSLIFKCYPAIVVSGINDAETFGVQLLRKPKIYDKDSKKISEIKEKSTVLLTGADISVNIHKLDVKISLDEILIQKELVNKVTIKRYNSIHKLSDYYDCNLKLINSAEPKYVEEPSTKIKDSLANRDGQRAQQKAQEEKVKTSGILGRLKSEPVDEISDSSSYEHTVAIIKKDLPICSANSDLVNEIKKPRDEYYVGDSFKITHIDVNRGSFVFNNKEYFLKFDNENIKPFLDLFFKNAYLKFVKKANG